MMAIRDNKALTAGIAGLCVLLAVSMTVLVNTLVPYEPVKVRAYEVTPHTVCPGDPVEGRIIRDFTEQFKRLELRESWVSVPDERTIASFQGDIPGNAIGVTDGFESAVSPLLQQAPDEPGTYRVDIHAEWHGDRFGWELLPATGEKEFSSTGTVRVTACQGGAE